MTTSNGGVVRDFSPYADRVEQELQRPVLQSCATRHVDGSFFGQEGVLCAVRGGLVFARAPLSPSSELLKIPTQKLHSVELEDQIGGYTLQLETERGVLSFGELAREHCAELLLGAGFEPQRVGQLLQSAATASNAPPAPSSQADALAFSSSTAPWHSSVTSTQGQAELPQAQSGDVKPPWRAAMSAPLQPAPWTTHDARPATAPELCVPVMGEPVQGEVVPQAKAPPPEALFDDVTPVDPALVTTRPASNPPAAGARTARAQEQAETSLRHSRGRDKVQQLLRELTPHSQVRVRSSTGAEVVLRGAKLQRLLAQGRLGPDTWLAVIGGDENFIRLGDTPLLSQQQPRVLGTSARALAGPLQDDEITGEFLVPDPPDTSGGVKRGCVISVVLTGVGAAMGTGVAGLIGGVTGAVGGLLLGVILGGVISRKSAR